MKLFGFLFVLLSSYWSSGTDLTHKADSCEDCDPMVWVPSAFSPNGDGTNDELQLYSTHVIEVELKVYDQTGVLVFFTTNLSQAWDGTTGGDIVPQGTYAYLVKYLGDGENGLSTWETRGGSITIIH